MIQEPVKLHVCFLPPNCLRPPVSFQLYQIIYTKMNMALRKLYFTKMEEHQRDMNKS